MVRHQLMRCALCPACFLQTPPSLAPRSVSLRLCFIAHACPPPLIASERPLSYNQQQQLCRDLPLEEDSRYEQQSQVEAEQECAQ